MTDSIAFGGLAFKNRYPTIAVAATTPPVAAPTVTSASRSVGDTAGGYSIDIGGTNLSGATAVTFGGTPATSVVVNSSISITCTVPAGSAGAATIAVTTAGGTGSNGGLFTYFSPASLTLTGWYRSYAGNPWTGTASAGASGARSVEAGSAPGTSSLNGLGIADFVAASSNYLLDATNLADAYLSLTGYRVVILINLTTAPAPAGAIYDNPGILTEGGGNWGIVYNNAGIHCYHNDGGYQVASSAAAVATGGWHVVDVIYNGVNLTLSVDGTAGTPAPAGTLGSITAAFRLGANYAPAVYTNAKIAEVVIANASLSSTSSTTFKSYVNSRYALSL